jgi:hypothetical protein
VPPRRAEAPREETQYQRDPPGLLRPRARLTSSPQRARTNSELSTAMPMPIIDATFVTNTDISVAWERKWMPAPVTPTLANRAA